MKKTPQINLPKWPFYIGDLLLVALVLGIFIQAKGHLDNLEIFWCVTGIAVGAVIFILPFVLEYKGNVHLATMNAKAKERENDIIRLERIFEQMSSVNETVTKQVDKHERTLMVFESLVKRMETRLKGEDQEDTVVTFEQESPVDTKVVEGEENMADDSDDLELEFEDNDEETSDEDDEDDDDTEAGEPATIIAHVQTGIGSKLFIRGEGGGLRRDKGLPMEFIETGTWQWISENTEGPIHYRIYKNDEEAAEGSDLMIEPGETQEIQPQF